MDKDKLVFGCMKEKTWRYCRDNFDVKKGRFKSKDDIILKVRKDERCKEICGDVQD